MEEGGKRNKKGIGEVGICVRDMAETSWRVSDCKFQITFHFNGNPHHELQHLTLRCCIKK